MSATTATPQQLLSVARAADLLDCSRAHVYRLIAARELASVAISAPTSTRTKTRIRAVDLDAYIERHTTAP